MVAKKKAKASESSVIDKSKTEHYQVHDEKTPGGRKAFDVGDDIADQLRGKDQDGLQAVAKKNGFEDAFKRWVSNGLNFGMLRMNTGNKLRAIARAKAEGGSAKPKKAAAKKKAA